MNEHEMDSAKQRLQEIYSASNFEALAAVGTEILSSYYRKAGDADARVRNWKSAPDLVKTFADSFSKAQLTGPSVQKAKDLMHQFLDNAAVLHSPKYMGHQVPPPIPAAALFDFLASASNQSPGLYEMGPSAVAAEKTIINEIMRMLGWDIEKSLGVVTSGGSLANLTAILAARNAKYPDFWTEGSSCVKSGLRPALVASKDSHYCVSRSAGILGLGANQILKVELDTKRRIKPKALKDTLITAKEKGLEVFCIVGTAGTTPTGSFDPLEEMAAIAKEFGIWLHIDGAHGASALFSPAHRNLIKGIEFADSIVWDTHKMHHVPALSTFVFYRDKKSGMSAFQQDAPYLHDPQSLLAMEFDGIPKNLECTRHSALMSFWGIWNLYGKTLFADIIDLTFARTKELHSIILESDDFEALHEPQCNILCFRFKKEKLKRVFPDEGKFQKKLRDNLVQDGEFYTTATKLDEHYCLRVTIINPLTESAHLHAMLNRYRALAQEMLP